MKLNGLNLSTHFGSGDQVTLVIAATIADAAALDGKDLIVTEDDGTEVARYSGYSVASVATDGEYTRVTCVRKLDDASKTAIEGLEASAKSLSDRISKLSADDVAPLRSAIDSVTGTDLPAVRSSISTLAASQAGSMSQSELHGLSGVWPDWAEGGWYSPRQLVRYEGHYYFVLADVNGAAKDAVPDKDTEHYKLMSDPDEGGVFPFSAPLGDSDAYGRGDRVSVQGVTYVSQVDGNKSIPGQGEDGQKYWLKA